MKRPCLIGYLAPFRPKDPIPQEGGSGNSPDNTTMTNKYKRFRISVACVTGNGVVKRPSLQSVRAAAMLRFRRPLRRWDSLRVGSTHHEKEDHAMSTFHPRPPVALSV